MDATKENQRFYIFMRLQLGEDATQIHKDLQTIFPEQALSYHTCARWIRDFKKGRLLLNDKDRCGAPKSVSNENLVENIKSHIDADPNTSIKEISSDLDVSFGTVQKILHEELFLRKIAARWVPHILTSDQKINRVKCARELLRLFEPNEPKRLTDIVTGDETWITFYGIPNKRSNMMWLKKDDPRPVVCRPGFQSRKRLFTIFFNFEGPVAVDVLPEKTTITGTYYRENVLPKVVQEINCKRPTIGTQKTLLLHDNASAHKTGAVTQYLVDNGICVLPHPAYSPDLAPCDFWLFPKLKGLMAGHKFSRVQDLAKAVNSVLRSIPKDEYREALNKWIERLRRCVEVGGEYFEGL